MTNAQQNIVYVVDSNFMINFHKWMPQSTFPRFWSELERTLIGGKWVLLDIVVDEICREPALKKWCEKLRNSGYVTKITNADKLSGAQINNQYPMIDVTSGNSENDTYIIAHAKANGYGILSDENPRRTTADLHKIPDVCTALNIVRNKKAEFFYRHVGITEAK